MIELFEVSAALLGIYRERGFAPDFWAEPCNALSNGAFLLAAACALWLAVKQRALSPTTLAMIVLAGVIGCGSFLFHTLPNELTMWLDVIPIVMFQVLFMWLFFRRVLVMSPGASTAIVVGVAGLSLALFPLHEPLNGSLFYAPSLGVMLAFGAAWAQRSDEEPYVMMLAACCFTLAVAVRSADWVVPWTFGSHFLWHLLNGVVVYLAIRTWIVHVGAERRAIDLLGGAQESRPWAHGEGARDLALSPVGGETPGTQRRLAE